ncbi:hypothetical protein [Aeromicrobium sp.]|uniref:hypothetical protein n=1 Tax=Aeromicrobium sp. TaxID=1871063 RepID=UPI003D6AA724
MKAAHRATGIVAALLVVALAGCGSDEAKKPERTDVPRGFDVPAGVTITKAGSTLELGKPASVVYQIDEQAASAITVVVNKVDKGSIKKDFAFFSLDDEAKASTPYYVRLNVLNEGPSGLGRVRLPVLAHTRSNKVFPPSELVGTFKPCRNPALPKSFLKGKDADLCLIFLLPKGEKLQSIDLRTGTEADAIHWKP